MNIRLGHTYLEKAFSLAIDAPEEALNLCDDYLKNNGMNGDCASIQYHAHSELGNWNDAYKSAQKCIEFDPIQAVNYITRGKAAYCLGLFQNSIEDGKSALKLSSSKTLGSLPYRLISLSYAALGDKASALEYANQIPELESGEWFPPCGPMPAGTKAQFIETVQQMVRNVK